MPCWRGQPPEMSAIFWPHRGASLQFRTNKETREPPFPPLHYFMVHGIDRLAQPKSRSAIHIPDYEKEEKENNLSVGGEY